MTVKTLPSVEVSEDAIVLAVTASEEDVRSLRLLCEGSCWDLRLARSFREARAWLSQHSSPVVLCAPRLPDGDWKTVLRFTEGLPDPPNLVVFSRQADNRMWTEVLNLGGFDVLAFPTVQRELLYTISTAWRNWEDRAHTQCGEAEAIAHCV